MGSPRDGIDGRSWTMPVRVAEAQRRAPDSSPTGFGPDGGGKRYVIAGDFNDYAEKVVISGDRRNGYHFTPATEADSAVQVLTADGFSEKRRAAPAGDGPLDSLPYPRATGAAPVPARLPAGLAGATRTSRDRLPTSSAPATLAHFPSFFLLASSTLFPEPAGRIATRALARTAQALIIAPVR